MYLTGKITVTTVLPDPLARLKDIAYNLWWTWNSDAIDLFREIDLPLWEKLGKNPVRFLQEVSQKRLYEKINDPEYMQRYHSIAQAFDRYMSDDRTWFNINCAEMKEYRVAYFSAEYGLNEVLPIYSGGLGVLSGDHCKAASDLGIPFTAIGIFYKQGYFNQHINREGWQETNYPPLNVYQFPIMPVTDSNGNEQTISLEFPGRHVYAKIWQVKIGRVSLYLLDTDTEQNSPGDRLLTARLYGGDQETRIQQEIFLGIGGIRVLEKLGINATVYHMNEGHSAFMGLELIRKLVQEKSLPYPAAKEFASSSIAFTTHTPVPAGNDVFPLHMIDKYFNNFWGFLGISRHEFLDLGLKVSDSQNFNMTVLAMTLAGWINGVSELHGQVTRNIFNNLWQGVPEEEVPVSHVTNGIHTLTWLSPNIRNLYDKYLDSEWKEKIYDSSIWEKVAAIPDDELWQVHCTLKRKMILFIREKLKSQYLVNGEPLERIREIDGMLDPNALTIGFARRFATYKRANLIFRNLERIRKIFNAAGRPVQIIFAGKAHPADRPAHEVIKNIHDIANQEGFKGKVILVENYNMTVARNLIQGVDIWLNNPRRPLEASGTSGQKAAINGILNFSILDGWWVEGFNGANGWAIGDDMPYGNEYFQDNADSESLYDILENQIVPLFYEKNGNGVPMGWTNMMKESIRSLSWKFSTHRMVQEYAEEIYLPSIKRSRHFMSEGYNASFLLSSWKKRLLERWQQVQIIADKDMDGLKERKSLSGEPVHVSTRVYLGELEPSDVKVEVYYGIQKEAGISGSQHVEMSPTEKVDQGTWQYGGNITLQDGGQYAYTFRVLPWHPLLLHKFEMGLIRWVVQ